MTALTPQAAPEPAADTVITIEPLRQARVHVNNEDPAECVLQFTTPTGHLFLSLPVEELSRLGERFVLDAALLQSGQFSGRG